MYLESMKLSAFRILSGLKAHQLCSACFSAVQGNCNPKLQKQFGNRITDMYMTDHRTDMYMTGKNLVEFSSCHSVTHEQVFADTGSHVCVPIQSTSIASLAWLGCDRHAPCMLIEETLCDRVPHTQQATRATETKFLKELTSPEAIGRTKSSANSCFFHCSGK